MGAAASKRALDEAPGERPASQRLRLAGVLPVCSLEETEPEVVCVNYVATKDLGIKPVYDSFSGEELDPEL
eukprot:6559434-Lingulodinium_polyedra.AAC.1